jgi:hypothetical protein
MSKLITKERMFLLSLILAFLLIRSVYFTQHLNFSSDQAEQATKAMELYKQHEITLIGPHISMQYQGRLLFQGPFYYYMLMGFLLLGNFDPIISSYLFTVFCALMIIPLYIGTKLLINKKAAILLSIIYTFLPYYVDYTRFHWNPTYQFSLIPLVIFFMGWYKKTKSKWIFLSLSFLLGLLLQLHYQFIIVIVAVAIYYFVIKRIPLSLFGIYVLGLLLGLFPTIVFELRNQFYNTQTLLLFLQHWKEASSSGGGIHIAHYYLTISFMFLLALLGLFAKYLPKGKKFILFSTLLAIILCTWSVAINFRKPEESFWSYARHWSYLDEYKVYTIIKKTNIKEYNVANLTYYDTKSAVVKYLLKRDNISINYDDYYQNKYLFVIKENNQKVFETLSYEVSFFKPSTLLKTWKINNYYNLYLLRRDKPKVK